MAKRLSDTNIWDKEWFMELSPRLKCAVKYVRDKCDLIGIWKPNWSLANSQIKGETIVTEQELLEIDCGRQFKKIGEKIACIDFIIFQYGENLNTKSPIHKKIINLLERSGYTIYTLSNRVVNRVDDTPQVKEEEKEEVEVEEDEKEKEIKNKEKVPPQKKEPPISELGNHVDEKLKIYEEWSFLISEQKDQFFETLLYKEKLDYPPKEIISDHLELLARYPSMQPRTQQAFRYSLLKHFRENKDKIKHGKNNNGSTAANAEKLRRVMEGKL